MVDISWPSPLNVGALFSVPDKTTFFLAALYFCSPQFRTLLKCPSPLTTPPPHQWWCSVSLLRNQGSAAVLITKVGRGGGGGGCFWSLLFALLHSVVDPRTTHFECTCSEQLGLVVSDDLGPQLCCISPLHDLQKLARPKKLVRHPTRVQASDWSGSTWEEFHLWVPNQAAPCTFKAASRLTLWTCMGLLTCIWLSW